MNRKGRCVRTCVTFIPQYLGGGITKPMYSIMVVKLIDQNLTLYRSIHLYSLDVGGAHSMLSLYTNLDTNFAPSKRFKEGNWRGGYRAFLYTYLKIKIFV